MDEDYRKNSTREQHIHKLLKVIHSDSKLKFNENQIKV